MRSIEYFDGVNDLAVTRVDLLVAIDGLTINRQIGVDIDINGSGYELRAKRLFWAKKSLNKFFKRFYGRVYGVLAPSPLGGDYLGSSLGAHHE
jgi:hypothetical protein